MKILIVLVAFIVLITIVGIMAIAMAHILFWFEQREARDQQALQRDFFPEQIKQG